MRKKKVLILGAKGMLGKEFVRIFYKSGDYQVLAWDNDRIDVGNLSQLEQKIKPEKPEIIINCAAHNGVDLIEKDEDEFQKALQLNAEAPGCLAKIAKELDSVLVHFTSDYIFDGKKELYLETDQPSPISLYGQTKAQAEKLIQEKGDKFYIIRTSKIFGEPGVSEGAKKSFFALLLELSETRDELTLVDSERSCFTYAPDLAKAVKKLLEDKFEFGIYHLINEGPATWYGGLRRCFEVVGKDTSIIKKITPAELPRPAQRPIQSVLKNTKFPPLRHYEEALEEWLKK